jgi:hypothetical protein
MVHQRIWDPFRDDFDSWPLGINKGSFHDGIMQSPSAFAYLSAGAGLHVGGAAGEVGDDGSASVADELREQVGVDDDVPVGGDASADRGAGHAGLPSGKRYGGGTERLPLIAFPLPPVVALPAVAFPGRPFQEIGRVGQWMTAVPDTLSRVPVGTVLDCVARVFGAGAIPKVAHLVVTRIAVTVSHLLTFRAWPEERACDEDVHTLPLLHSEVR